MPERNRKRAVATAVLALGAFLLVHRLGWLQPVTDPFTRLTLAAAAPVYRVGAAVGLIRDAAMGQAVVSPDELERLRLDNARLLALVAENQSLKDALDYQDRAADPLLAARVVSRTSGELFHGLVLDRGSEDGVRVGQPVVAGDGVIVGKVASVTRLTAVVMLLTDSRSRLAVALQDAAGTLGVLEGDRGISMTVSLIPQQTTVTPGDMVVTSGIEPGIRRGLAVGTVDQVARDSQDPFQTALIAPPSAAARPMFVTILLTPGTE